jgi:hypothetical protein
MAAANVQLPGAAARASVQAGRWAGGVNLTAVRMAEDRAYGWFHAMASTGGSRCVVVAGTHHGVDWFSPTFSYSAFQICVRCTASTRG